MNILIKASNITMLEVPHLQNRSGGLWAEYQHSAAAVNAARPSGSQSEELGCSMCPSVPLDPNIPLQCCVHASVLGALHDGLHPTIC